MSRPRARLTSLLRLVLALPSVLGGTAVALVASGGFGRAEPIALVSWLAVAPVLLTRPGERLAVRRWLRFQALPAPEHDRLRPVLDLALDRCGIPVDAVDLYLTPGKRVNAFSAGRRSMALTRGLLTEVLAGRLPDALLHAVLLHELGHLANGHRRYALATGWLSAPGRPVVWLARVLVSVLLRGRVLSRLRYLAAIAVGLAGLVRAAAAGDWTTMAIVAALGFAAVTASVLRPWVSRHDELAADRYAALHGAGPTLALALVLGAGEKPQIRVHERLASHPTPEHRQRLLRDMSSGPDPSPSPSPPNPRAMIIR